MSFPILISETREIQQHLLLQSLRSLKPEKPPKTNIHFPSPLTTPRLAPPAPARDRVLGVWRAIWRDFPTHPGRFPISPIPGLSWRLWRISPVTPRRRMHLLSA
jgi:hypothetical protein